MRHIILTLAAAIAALVICSCQETKSIHEQLPNFCKAIDSLVCYDVLSIAQDDSTWRKARHITYVDGIDYRYFARQEMSRNGSPVVTLSVLMSKTREPEMVLRVYFDYKSLRVEVVTPQYTEVPPWAEKAGQYLYQLATAQ